MIMQSPNAVAMIVFAAVNVLKRFLAILPRHPCCVIDISILVIVVLILLFIPLCLDLLPGCACVVAPRTRALRALL